MRFRSDEQRKAVFSNLFCRGSNRFALYVDPSSKRVRSSEYPEVDFKLETDYRPGVDSVTLDEALQVLGTSPEEYWSGVNVGQVKLKPSLRGKGGHYRPAATEESADEVLRWKLFQEGVMGEEAKEKVEKLKDLDAYKEALGRAKERTPLIMISHFRGMGSETPRIVAHELGHHMDYEARELGRYNKAHVEPTADYAANIISGGVVRKKYKPVIKDVGIQHAEYAIALKEAKTPSYEDLLKYADEEDLAGGILDEI